MDYILYIIIIAGLFVLVYLNNKRNVTKLRNRKNRNFKQNYFNKKKDQDPT